MDSIGVALIGAGAIALANHLPGLRLAPAARLVAVCDSNPQVLAAAVAASGAPLRFQDYHQAIDHPDVQAVIVATPNNTHAQIVEAAAAARRHVLCEKPLALDYPTALAMYRAAEAAGIRHMTAFTYRFVPAMRYMVHQVQAGAVGKPYHFRAQRFQDWGERPMGWRQVKALAGTGEMADMLSHRIDYGHLLMGPTRRLVADLRTFIPVRGGQPSDVDDWVAMLTRYDGDATGVLESTKLATGRGEGHRGQDTVEINGAEGTLVYSTQRPLELWIGNRRGKDLERLEVPREYRVWPGSPRDPDAGDPLVTFRYDQVFEFIDAIAHDRPCRPTLLEGVRVQAVMDAAVLSHREQRWVDVQQP